MGKSEEKVKSQKYFLNSKNSENKNIYFEHFLILKKVIHSTKHLEIVSFSRVSYK